MKLAEEILNIIPDRLLYFRSPVIEAIQSILDKRYGKPIDECLELLNELKNESLIASTQIYGLFRDLKSKLETMKSEKDGE